VLTLCRDRDGAVCGGVSSRGGRRRVVRLCVTKRKSEADRGFVSRYIAMEVCSIWREEESETRGRSETAREERPIGLCQVVRGLAKMPSFLPHLPTLPKYKTQMQNYWIPQFEFFGKLVKYKH